MSWTFAACAIFSLLLSIGVLALLLLAAPRMSAVTSHPSYWNSGSLLGISRPLMQTLYYGMFIFMAGWLGIVAGFSAFSVRRAKEARNWEMLCLSAALILLSNHCGILVGGFLLFLLLKKDVRAGFKQAKDIRTASFNQTDFHGESATRG